MKVRLLVPEWGHKVGDIVDAKYFKDMTAEEQIEVRIGGSQDFEWEPEDMFIPSIDDVNPSPWGFMWDEEVEVLG